MSGDETPNSGRRKLTIQDFNNGFEIDNDGALWFNSKKIAVTSRVELKPFLNITAIFAGISTGIFSIFSLIHMLIASEPSLTITIIENDNDVFYDCSYSLNDDESTWNATCTLTQSDSN